VVLAALLSACTGQPSVSTHSSSAAVHTPAPVTTFGTQPTKAVGPVKAAALQKALDRSRIGYDDALATVITTDGVWSGASGVDGPRQRKALPDDVVSIASITKTFTAALIFKLAEEKKIDLDAPLARYLQGAAANASNGATVRQALAMRSGIPDTPDSTLTAVLAVPGKVWTMQDIVARMPEPTGKPGVTSAYSNPTYKLLALAAAHAGGATWVDLVRTELVAPASAPGTLVVQSAGTRTPGRWAVPTTAGPWGIGGTLPYVADTSFSYGATDMAADTRSLATWVWALFAGRIVSSASVAAMTVDHGTEIGSGLDPLSGSLPERSLGHEGSKDGYHTLFVAVPSRHAVVVVAVNDADAPVDVIAGDLLSALG